MNFLHPTPALTTFASGKLLLCGTGDWPEPSSSWPYLSLGAKPILLTCTAEADCLLSLFPGELRPEACCSRNCLATWRACKRGVGQRRAYLLQQWPEGPGGGRGWSGGSAGSRFQGLSGGSKGKEARLRWKVLGVGERVAECNRPWR